MAEGRASREGSGAGTPAERGPDAGDRTLRALGLDGVPREEPLLYPGAWPRESGVLHGDRLLPPDRLTYEDRTPVLAIGSNASPGQLRHKMAEFGIESPLPMVRSRVTGLDVGVSAHVSRMGYVSASPVSAPGTVRELFLLWLDAEQLAVIDASEGVSMASGNFDRAWLPAPTYASSRATARCCAARTPTSTATACCATAPVPRGGIRVRSGRSSPTCCAGRPGCGSCSGRRPRSSARGRGPTGGCASGERGCSLRRSG